jgi:hypothetical protein
MWNINRLVGNATVNFNTATAPNYNLQCSGN